VNTPGNNHLNKQQPNHHPKAGLLPVSGPAFFISTLIHSSMKHPSPIRKAFLRLTLAILGTVFFITSAGCRTPSDPGIEVIHHKLDQINDQFLDSREQAGQVAAWQIAAALLIVAAGFALIAGAALGSSARRAAAAFRQEEERGEDPEESL